MLSIDMTSQSGSCQTMWSLDPDPEKSNGERKEEGLTDQGFSTLEKA